MSNRARSRVALLLALAALEAGCRAAAGQAGQSAPGESARVALTQSLPVLDGSRLAVTVVEVRYGPGGRSTPHSHPCPVIGSVIEGALETQVDGGPVQVIRAGQSFYEAANGVHRVSANASNREAVRFLATFVCDRPGPLVTPAVHQ